MRNETLCGNPAAAADPVARGLPRCLACRHENPSGEQFCQACGSSLYLVLCGACEAVNGAGAQRCHNCGAALDTEASDKPAAVPRPARISRGRLALILMALVVTAALAYQYFPRSIEADRSQTSGVVRSAPMEASEPPSPTPPPSKKAESVAKQAESAAKKTDAVAKKAESVAKKGDAVAKKADAAEPAAGASASATPAPQTGSLPRVTHTRSTDTDQAPTSAAVAQPVRSAGQQSERGCGEAVAALGLCNVSSKSGGK